MKTSELIDNALPEVIFTWVKKGGEKVGNEVMCPVYLNITRGNLLFSVKVGCGDNNPLTLY